MTHFSRRIFLALLTLATVACNRSSGDAPSGTGSAATPATQTSREILNVSYDPTRELYAAFNPLFAAHWKQKTGEELKVKMSHGGSGKQARAVIDGLEADVVTLALAYDVDALHAQGGLVSKDWMAKLPNQSAPYTSTIVFLVRKGNPKGIKDWGDLVKSGVQIITPNPKTSGGARWNYLAAWGYALRQPGGDAHKALEFVSKLIANVPVLDSGARGATTTFVERKIGDVLLAWENEALLATKRLANAEVEIIAPSVSILAEPSVAVVARDAEKNGNAAVAKAYLEYLYEPAAQELAAKHFYRPRNVEIAAKYASTFPTVAMFTIDEVFGGWEKAQKEHFADGGTFDKVIAQKGAPAP